jgi:hypothetical protein
MPSCCLAAPYVRLRAFPSPLSWPATTQPQGSPSGAASPDSRHGWSVPPQSRTAPAMAAVAAWRRREKAHEQASDRRFYLFPHQDQEEGRFRADQTGVESGGGVYPLGSKSGDVTHGGYREIGFNCPASRNLIERDRRVVIADPLSILNPRRFTALKGPREAPVPGTDIQVVIR